MKIIPLEEFDAVELLEGLRKERLMGEPLRCRDKKRYSTESKARAALYTIRAHGERRPSNTKPTRVYACPLCAGYHLTSQLS